MTFRRRLLLLASSILVVGLAGAPFATFVPGVRAAASLPLRLSDQEFWRLSSES